MLSHDLKSYLNQTNLPWTHVFIAKGNAKESKPEYIWEQGKEKIFDLASMTKAIFTAPLIYKNIDLNQTLEDVFENEVPSQFADLKISEILSHKSGLPAWQNFWINQLDAENKFKQESDSVQWSRFLLRLKNTKLQKKDFFYSDVGYIFLGFILSKIKKTSLHDLAKHWFSGTSITFHPKNTTNIVPTAYCELQGKRLRGLPHDENCRSFGSVSGHAGLFGTGEDLILWLKNSINTDFFRKFLIEAKNFEGVQNSVLGWRRYGSSNMFQTGIGHYGFTGTAIMLDPNTYNYSIILTNSVYKERNPSDRTKLRELVFGEFGK